MTLTASASRLETDFRTPTPFGQLRAFVSGDFAGSNRTYRLRHAFGQWRGVLIGQTWSAFSDPEAEPDGLDFEGLNAISLFRQPGIRWTKPLNDRTEFAIALENPAPDITGASGVNQIPDLIARVRFNAWRGPLGPPHPVWRRRSYAAGAADAADPWGGERPPERGPIDGRLWRPLQRPHPGAVAPARTM